MENIRELALDVLLYVEKKEGFDGVLVRSVLDKYDYLEKRDKAFLKRLTEGTIERQIELDYDLDQISGTPVRKMKPFIRVLLRMGAYQILYMDTVPDSAACNEAVKLAQKRKFSSLKGFVNGVLRNLARNKDQLKLPDRALDPLEYLSVKYSMPRWIVELWTPKYGMETTETILEGLLKEHPVSLRFSTRLSGEERLGFVEEIRSQGVELTKSPYLDYVYEARGVENVKKLPGFSQGAFMVQDVSSCLAVEAAGIQDHFVVMDLCGAPGGKTILCAEKAKKVFSFDVSEEKTEFIRENAVRMRAENVVVAQHDASSFTEEWKEKADLLLLDVPCSGLGVIGKKRDIKYRVSKEGIQSLNRLQKEIVENSWQYVKPGGILLYCTCTINPEENEKMVEWMLKRFPLEPEAVEKDSNYVQLLPGVTQTDGFFYAKFRRKI